MKAGDKVRVLNNPAKLLGVVVGEVYPLKEVEKDSFSKLDYGLRVEGATGIKGLWWFKKEDLELVEEINGYVFESGKAAKNDIKDGKPDLSLLPKSFNDQVAFCMMAGALKYDRGNYKQGHKVNQLIAAAKRHLDLIQEGEDVDKDTTERLRNGCESVVSKEFREGMGDKAPDILHWANVACCALMAIEQIKLGTLIDDRESCKIYGEVFGHSGDF